MYFQLNNYAKGNPSMIPNEHNTKKNNPRPTRSKSSNSWLDIDRTEISKIESGIRSLTDNEVLFFAKVLEVPIEILYDISTDNYKR